MRQYPRSPRVDSGRTCHDFKYNQRRERPEQNKTKTNSTSEQGHNPSAEQGHFLTTKEPQPLAKALKITVKKRTPTTKTSLSN